MSRPIYISPYDITSTRVCICLDKINLKCVIWICIKTSKTANANLPKRWKYFVFNIRTSEFSFEHRLYLSLTVATITQPCNQRAAIKAALVWCWANNVADGGLALSKYIVFVWIIGLLLYKWVQPFKPSRCIKASFYIPENRLNFPSTRVLDWIFPWNWFTIAWQFSLIFHSRQVILIHYKSRIATAIHGL